MQMNLLSKLVAYQNKLPNGSSTLQANVTASELFAYQVKLHDGSSTLRTNTTALWLFAYQITHHVILQLSYRLFANT